MLIRIGPPGQGGSVEPGLVSERRRPDIGVVGIQGDVDDLRDMVGDRAE